LDDLHRNTPLHKRAKAMARDPGWQQKSSFRANVRVWHFTDAADIAAKVRFLE
jgi:hypothetical protein